MTITINLGNVSPNITNIQILTCINSCDSCVPLVGYENVPVSEFPLTLSEINSNISKIKVVSIGSDCDGLSQCLDIIIPTTTTTTTTTTAPPTTTTTTTTAPPTTTTTTTIPPTTTTTTTIPPTTTTTTIPPPNIKISNIVQGNIDEGYVSFDIVVTGSPFVGYAKMVLSSSSVNTKTMNSFVSIYGSPLRIFGGSPIGTEDVRIIPITLGVGTYSEEITHAPGSIPQTEDVNYDTLLIFCTNSDGTGTIPSATVTGIIIKEGQQGPAE